MELFDAVRARRMVRSYDPGAPVPEPVLHALLDAATRAPSAGNTQGWDVVVLRSAADRDRFWSVTRSDGGPDDDWLAGMRTAPLLLVVLADPGAYARRYRAPDKARAAAQPAGEGDAAPPWWHVDAAMASLLVLLAAVDAGLGGCFFGVPPARHAAVREAFGVPADRLVTGVVSVGTPAPHPTRGDAARPRSPHRPHRRAVGEAASDGRFGVPLA